MKDYRLVVLGSGGVGKTSLINKFLHGVFLDNYIPTVEDIHRPIIQLPDGDIHGVEILDTAGLHQFPAMRQLSIQSGRAFVIVFSLEDSTTFQDALVFADSIRKIKGDETPIVMVGNKFDLDERRTVMTSEATQMAEERNCGYMETSALRDHNIQKVFLEMLSEIFQTTSGKEKNATSQRPHKLSLRLRNAIHRSRSSTRSRSMSDSSGELSDEGNNNNNNLSRSARSSSTKASCVMM